MRQAHHPHPRLEPFMDLARPQDRIGAFHAEDETDGQRIGILRIFPGLHVLCECISTGQYNTFALFLQHVVVGDLTTGSPVNRRSTQEARQDTVLPLAAHGEFHQGGGHPAAPHLRQTGEGDIVRVLVGGAHLRQWERKIPVKFDTAVRHGIVTIEDEHGVFRI